MPDDQLVFLVGATGVLGGEIADALLERGARVRALVRPGSAGERTQRLLATAQQAAGLEIVRGDIRDPVDALARSLEGAEVVVSAVQGGPDVVTDGQINLIRAGD